MALDAILFMIFMRQEPRRQRRRQLIQIIQPYDDIPIYERILLFYQNLPQGNEEIFISKYHSFFTCYRNRINSDYTTLSSSSSNSNSSKFPFSLEELNHALLSYGTGDIFQQQYPQTQIQQQQQQQHAHQQDFYPSIISTMTNSLTHRTFSSSSSSNSSLAPQYI